MSIVPAAIVEDLAPTGTLRAAITERARIGIAIRYVSPAVRQDSQVILRWSPDGKSIAFVDDRDGVSNIWRQPVAGGPPQQITDFNDSYIFAFDWSRDGRLAAARGAINFDVVLITNFE